MSGIMQFPVERFQVAREEPHEAPAVLMCMDDRYNLLGLIGWQLASGPDGLGRDVATAMEQEKPGSFLGLDIPIHRLGARLAKEVLEPNGIQGVMHFKCTAYGEARAIRQTMHDEPEVVYENARQIDGELREAEFEQAREASDRISQGGVILPTAMSDRELLHGTEDLPPVSRIHLVEGDHQANTILVDHGTGAYWDARAAYEAGFPAYYIGMGILANIVHPLIERVIPISKRSMVIASAVRHGAIIDKLPQPGGQPLNIHSV